MRRTPDLTSRPTHPDHPGTERAKAPGARADEARTDEARVDEARVDEARVDEARVDEARVDEARVDEPRIPKEISARPTGGHGQTEPGRTPPLPGSLSPPASEPDPAEPPRSWKPRWLEETPFWAISAVLHLLAILALLVIPLFEAAPPKAVAKTIQLREAPDPVVYDPERERDIDRREKLLDPRKLLEEIVVERKIDEIAHEIPQGSEMTHRADVERLRRQTEIAIAAGGGAAGRQGLPHGYGRRQAREGGDPGSESAVRAALEWLRRHQDPDGRWSALDYQQHGENRHLDFGRYGPDRAFEEHDVGVTGLAMLAYAGFGQTHRDGDQPEYVECLRKAVKWLKSQQQLSTADPQGYGRYGSGDHEQWIYDHAIATMAMSETLLMSNDVVGLKKSVKAAVELILKARNDGYGWRYGVRPGESDSSVTGWMVLALKAARNCRLGIPKAEFDRAFAGALQWFERATAQSGQCGYLVPGDEGSRLAKGHPDPYPYSKDLSCMTAVSVLCRIFGGESRRTPAIRRGVDRLVAESPRWQEATGRLPSTINFYSWYYGTYALYQYGGRDWETWNAAMRDALLKTQRRGNIQEDGSWDPIGEWGIAGGRVYSTALGAMTLEVYYRFARHAQKERSI